MYPKHISNLQYSAKEKIDELEKYKNLKNSDKINQTYGDVHSQKLTEKGIEQRSPSILQLKSIRHLRESHNKQTKSFTLSQRESKKLQEEEFFNPEEVPKFENDLNIVKNKNIHRSKSTMPRKFFNLKMPVKQD